MLYLHQVLIVPPSRRAHFDELLRDEWLPAVAREDGARVAWVAYGMDCAVGPDDVCMMTAISDPGALGRYSDRLRTGDLVDVGRRVGEQAVEQQLRILKPLRYDPLDVAFEDIPTVPTEGPTIGYMHDFVPPIQGQNRAYEDMMNERYTALSDTELSNIVLRACYETVAGGGPQPEHFNLSEICSSEALLQLLAYEIPKEFKQMGTWMWEALGVRDRWTTRLVRCATWSPIR